MNEELSNAGGSKLAAAAKDIEDAAGCLTTMIPGVASNVTEFMRSLPPSEKDIMTILDDQSRHLRAALIATTTLRSAIKSIFRTYEEGPLVGGERVLTFGEGRVAAEYKAKVKLLEAELRMTKAELLSVKALGGDTSASKI